MLSSHLAQQSTPLSARGLTQQSCVGRQPSWAQQCSSQNRSRQEGYISPIRSTFEYRLSNAGGSLSARTTPVISLTQPLAIPVDESKNTSMNENYKYLLNPTVQTTSQTLINIQEAQTPNSAPMTSKNCKIAKQAQMPSLLEMTRHAQTPSFAEVSSLELQSKTRSYHPPSRSSPLPSTASEQTEEPQNQAFAIWAKVRDQVKARMKPTPRSRQAEEQRASTIAAADASLEAAKSEINVAHVKLAQAVDKANEALERLLEKERLRKELEETKGQAVPSPSV